MRYDATRATLRGRYSDAGNPDLTIHDHRTGGVETVSLSDGAGGHGGGDAGVMRAFVRAVRGADSGALTSARASLESHLLAFAAERSRLTGATVDMGAYRADVERSVAAPALQPRCT